MDFKGLSPLGWRVIVSAFANVVAAVALPQATKRLVILSGDTVTAIAPCSGMDIDSSKPIWVEIVKPQPGKIYRLATLRAFAVRGFQHRNRAGNHRQELLPPAIPRLRDRSAAGDEMPNWIANSCAFSRGPRSAHCETTSMELAQSRTGKPTRCPFS
jgi:hypothetical protein